MSANKVILVTGSNSGIGYELVHILASKGHTVYLASRKESAGIEAVYDSLLKLRGFRSHEILQSQNKEREES
jgi:NAD(P)-dependent dehydrogenase (short-subunit alcohol dehydrogenase family)